MSNIFSVNCPKSEDHIRRHKHTKEIIGSERILFMYDDGIYVHCDKHGWIKFSFYEENGKKVSLENTSVKAKPNKGWIPAKQAMVKSYGEFDLKEKRCQ